MKRNAPDLKYFYHVIKAIGVCSEGYKVKRSLFAKIEGSLFCGSTKQMAKKQISLIIQSKN